MPQQSNSVRLRVIAVAALCVAGTVALAARTLLEPRRFGSPGDATWELTIDVNVAAGSSSATVALAPPWDTPFARTYGQRIEHEGLSLRRLGRSPAAGRDLVARATSSGRFRLRAVYLIHFQALPRRRGTGDPVTLSPATRERLVATEPGIDADDPAVIRVSRDLLASSPAPDAFPDIVFGWVTNRLAPALGEEPGDARSVLRSGRAGAAGRARAMVAILRAADVPARLVAGYRLRESEAAREHLWLEVHAAGRWQPYDPGAGYAGELPPSFVPMRRGGPSVVVASGDVEIDVRARLSRDAVPGSVPGGDEEGLATVLDLTRLPFETRQTLGLVLLLPFGVLVTLAIRHLARARTYGTFTPTLLGLAAAYVDPPTALVVGALVLLLGTAGLAALPGLHLARTPRLGVVFTLVAVGMGLGVSLLAHVDLRPQAAVILLPIVVLTNLVDRIYATVEDDGLPAAMGRLAWTLGTAAACFAIFERQDWGQWLLAHPETHLFTVAAMIAAGALGTVRDGSARGPAARSAARRRRRAGGVRQPVSASDPPAD